MNARVTAENIFRQASGPSAICGADVYATTDPLSSSSSAHGRAFHVSDASVACKHVHNFLILVLV